VTADYSSIAAVVVHYESPETLLKTVENLGQYIEADRIIVVDNSSSLSNLLSSIGATVLDDGSNRGYAGGVNHGIKYVTENIPGALEILVCTHEALFREGALESLLTTASEYPQGHIIGPRLVTPGNDGDDVIWSNGGFFSFPFLYPKHDKSLKMNGRRLAKWVDGAAFVIDLATWKKVGGVPEEFFMYMEDVALGELCRQHEIPVVVDLDAIVEQTANGPSRKLAIRNRILLAQRYMTLPQGVVVTIEVFLRQALMSLHPTDRVRRKARESRSAAQEARAMAKMLGTRTSNPAS
jgi:GT2 family glycosyltransferase